MPGTPPVTHPKIHRERAADKGKPMTEPLKKGAKDVEAYVKTKARTQAERNAVVSKKSFPYLDDLVLRPKQLLFCYHYTTNGFNASKAYVAAGFKSAPDSKAFHPCVHEVLRTPKVQEAIKRMVAESIGLKKVPIEATLIEQWLIMSSYDPSFFYNPDGSPAFTTWDQVPREYRCCIDSLETKYYGKDGDRKVTVLKLVDRKWAQDKLDRLIGMTREKIDLNVNVNITEEQKRELSVIFEGRLLPKC